jgi:hypothetical protein
MATVKDPLNPASLAGQGAYDMPMPGAFPTNLASQGQGHWDYPDYAGLLQKWMAPYQQQYTGEMAAQKAQLDLNQGLANERYSTGPNSTLERFKHQEAFGTLRHGMTVEQAQHQHDINLRQLTNSLAARGMLSSGEKDYQNAEEAWRFANLNKGEEAQYSQEQYGYQTQRSDAANQLTDYLRGIQQAYADAQRQGLSGLAQQQQTIAQTLSQLYQPTWVDESSQGGAGGIAGGVYAENNPGNPYSPGYIPGYIPGPNDPGWVDHGGPYVTGPGVVNPWEQDPASGYGNPTMFPAGGEIYNPLYPSPVSLPTPGTKPIKELPQGI